MQLADRIPNLLEGISCVTKDRHKAYTEPRLAGGFRIHTKKRTHFEYVFLFLN